MSNRRFSIGDSVQFTWINSGTTATDLHHEVYDGDETLVSSATMSSSGNGHYYSFFTIPDSSGAVGYYHARLKGSIEGIQFVRSHQFKAVSWEVD